MNILSIDVGIKNLAICLMEQNHEKKFEIINWNVINLSVLQEIPNKLCTCKYKKRGVKNANNPIIQCVKYAKYKKNNDYFCTIHSKKHDMFIVPPRTLNLKVLKKMKKNDLYNVFCEYKDNIPTLNIDLNYNKLTKTIILNLLEKYINEHCFEPIIKTNINAKDISLIDIGIILTQKFNDLLVNHPTIDYVIIENQISPLANRMKTIQGMITQYFIMKNILNIHFISSSNKLKICSELINYDNTSLTYNERKKAGIKNTETILNNDIYIKWIDYFKKHKKKDDLADSFLQCIWFIYKRI
jgi:hypothetical protein